MPATNHTWIALIRGLGGKYTLPMKELRRLLDELGLENVETYIQSGNAVFQTRRKAASKLADDISAAIGGAYGFAPRVILLSRKDLREAIESNPYPKAEAAPKSLHLFFLESAPKDPDLETLERLRTESERFTLKGKVFYVHTPEGFGRSKLATRVEKSLGVAGTARNWRSVSKIMELAEEVAST